MHLKIRHTLARDRRKLKQEGRFPKNLSEQPLNNVLPNESMCQAKRTA